ncbi:threonine/serine exporter family protein [Bacillus sp. V3B]|uniref:threonine/serine exporter family protein n=1 Tax=Bacillus sp. V3B TaxID=2804915 RepID=UPI00210AEEBD|nr:threonine/serine exporter family protein [Bacillus sp. V3B]MCQ6274521.1 threonine/serine exporter family protein [Bacillus sp. V3B]
MNNQPKRIVRLCLLAGEIMLKSGAETHRVEDTMNRIASSFGIPHSQSYVIPTGIIFSLNQLDQAKLIRVEERSTDLYKVAIVNDISRKISRGELTVEQAIAELKKVANANLAYPLWVQISAASIVGGGFLIMFKGVWGDFIPAMIAGGIGYYIYIYIQGIIKIRFFSECVAAFVIGVLALLAVKTGLGSGMDKIIIGSVMPLVPGLLITNAVRDLMDGHLVSALSKGADAFLTALAIGTGIAIVFFFS